MALQKEELAAYGYLRDILNDENDYDFILAIVIEYTKQGFARYFEEKVNDKFMQEMRFGDIVRKLDDEIMVLNKEQTLENAGYLDEDHPYEDICVRIPASICNNLTNAVLFYSEFNKNWPSTRAYSGEFELTLFISHDDQFIIDQFGGPLKAEYESIEHYSNEGE